VDKEKSLKPNIYLYSAVEFILWRLIIMDSFFKHDLSIKVSDDVLDVIKRAQSQLGHSSDSETINNFVCAGVILDTLLDKYPAVEAAYNDYKQSVMAERASQ
jgi:hypothetical protein